MKNFTPAEWIGFIISMMTMAVGVTAFSYSTFVVDTAYKDDKTEIMRRLNRIEEKIDMLNERR